jgi:Glu-tRNA(Gln) amidotransferase subunit E-like FAD-binding protein
LDRLGIPLVEIATAPDIKDGEHARETAEKLGGVLRATGMVQRGIGSIRQDLNVSVEGGERTELKGVQDLKLLPKIIDVEISRQRKEGVRDGGETRRIIGLDSEYMRPLPGAARIYPETDVLHVGISRELLEKAVVGESAEEKLGDLKKLGLNEQLAQRMAGSKELGLFEKIVRDTKADVTAVASTLLETVINLRRDGVETDKITEVQLKELFSLFAKGVIVKAAIPEVLRELPSGKTAEKIIGEKSLRKFSEKELEELVKIGKTFGELMREHRLRVDPAELQKRLKR